MDIIIGKTAGFCYGVKRAIEESDKEVSTNNGKQIYCLGELVHNKQVIENLERKGMKTIETLKEVTEKNCKVIIRAHGIHKKIYSEAKQKEIDIVDMTCPNVLKIHKLVEDYQKQGYYIFVIGVKGHPEVIGTLSHCETTSYLIEEEQDIAKAIWEFKKSKLSKVIIVAQTTFSLKKFENIVEIIKKELPKEAELILKNTICLATEQRQKETKELSQKVDMMIIIGGKNSSNTKKLYEIAKENCKKTICIETKEDIKELPKDCIIGIMAGASTPQQSIDEVINFLNARCI